MYWKGGISLGAEYSMLRSEFEVNNIEKGVIYLINVLFFRQH